MTWTIGEANIIHFLLLVILGLFVGFFVLSAWAEQFNERIENEREEKADAPNIE